MIAPACSTARGWPAALGAETPRAFLDAWQLRLRPSTARGYVADLRAFAGWLRLSPTAAVRRLLSLDGLRANDLIARHLAENRHLAAATVNRRLAALASLIDHAGHRGMIGWSLTVRRRRSRALRDMTGPDAPAIAAMFRRIRAHGDRILVARNTAMLALLANCALRASEMLGLDVEHLAEEGLWILGKGCDDRQLIRLNQPMRDLLLDWLAVRGPNPGPLFPAVGRHRGLPWRRDARCRIDESLRLSYRGLHRLIALLGDAATGRPTSPHRLRHSAITLRVPHCRDVLELAEFSRHKDVRTVQRYWDHAEQVRQRIADAGAADLLRWTDRPGTDWSRP